MAHCNVCLVVTTIGFLTLRSYLIDAFVFPDVKPNSFRKGDEIELKFDALTSIKTQAPIDSDKLPFCHNKRNVDDHENLGQYLTGSRIRNSPYTLRMKEDMFCQHVCVVDMGTQEEEEFGDNDKNDDNNTDDDFAQTETSIANSKLRNKMITKAIEDGYHHNWIVDDLDSASKVEDDEKITTRYGQGVPIGFIHDQTKEVYIHNHVNIEIFYHPVKETKQDDGDNPNKNALYRIVRFVVQPFSIHYDIRLLKEKEQHQQQQQQQQNRSNTKNNDHRDSYGNLYSYIIDNPIPSCITNTTDHPEHTSFDMIASAKYISNNFNRLQRASGLVLFTYDVIWKESLDLQWHHRWDIYVNRDDYYPHWAPIAVSVVIVLVLLLIGLTITICRLRHAAKLTPIPENDDDDNNDADVDDYDREEKEKEEDTETYDREKGRRVTVTAPTGTTTTTTTRRAKRDQPKTEGHPVALHQDQHKNHKWRLLHEDVFRPPITSPLLFSVCCGTGSHLLCTVLIFLTMAMGGLVSTTRRGSIPLSIFCIYPLTSIVAGYTTTRMYQLLLMEDEIESNNNNHTGNDINNNNNNNNSNHNNSRSNNNNNFKKRLLMKATAFTTLGFPGILLTFFLLIQIWSSHMQSTLALPTSTLIFFLSFETITIFLLTFLGSWMAYVHTTTSQDSFFPTEMIIMTTSTTTTTTAAAAAAAAATTTRTTTPPPHRRRRNIPQRLCMTSILCGLFSFFMNGYWPFLALYVEGYFILSSVWLGYHYGHFGFLLLAWLLSMMTTSQLNILTTYWQLCRENHYWWWNSWRNGASVGCIFLLFCLSFYDPKQQGFAYTSFKMTTFASILYTGTMILVSLSISLIFGFVGVMSSLWFTKTIYSMIVETV